VSLTAAQRFVLIRPRRGGKVHATGSELADGLTYCGRRSSGWPIATERSWLIEQWCAVCLRVAVEP
jgi:hypothetical protein